jgi:hypothetical protein
MEICKERNVAQVAVFKRVANENNLSTGAIETYEPYS